MNKVFLCNWRMKVCTGPSNKSDVRNYLLNFLIYMTLKTHFRIKN